MSNKNDVLANIIDAKNVTIAELQTQLFNLIELNHIELDQSELKQINQINTMINSIRKILSAFKFSTNSNDYICDMNTNLFTNTEMKQFTESELDSTYCKKYDIYCKHSVNCVEKRTK